MRLSNLPSPVGLFRLAAFVLRVALCLLPILSAPSQASVAEHYFIEADTRTISGASMGPHTEFWYDVASTATIDMVRAPEHQSAFIPAGGVVHVPAGGPVVWLKIRLNHKAYFRDWVLHSQTPHIQDVRFYGPFSVAGDELGEPVLTGTLTPYGTRPLGAEKFSMRIPLDYPDEYEVYVRLHSMVNKYVEFHLSDVVSFFQDEQLNRLFDGLCYGVLVGLLIYNLALLMVFRDAKFALYLTAGVFGLLTIASKNGHLARYAFTDLPVLGDIINAALPPLWAMFAGLFAWMFLDLRAHTRRLHGVLLGLVGCALVTAVIALLGDITSAQWLTEVIVLTGSLVTIGFTIAVICKGHPGGARFYLLGQLALFVGVLVAILQNWGVQLPDVLADNSIQVGVAIEYLLFSLALTSNVKAIKRDRARLHSERTALAIASETDPLTRTANRAGLAKAAKSLLAAPEQGRALIYMDLDKFKPINDTYGHAAGDATLIEIGKRLQAHLRDRDLVARLGGDEFAVLLSNRPSRAELKALCQRLLDDIERPIAFDGHTLQVGGSIGVAFAPTDATTLDGLTACADRAMYEVKSRGRNGVCFFDEIITTAVEAESPPTH